MDELESIMGQRSGFGAPGYGNNIIQLCSVLCVCWVPIGKFNKNASPILCNLEMGREKKRKKDKQRERERERILLTSNNSVHTDYIHVRQW